MLKLFVRDSITGTVHEYGTNQHDSLILQDDGSIHYYNLQNGCGSRFADEGYTFVLEDGTDPRERLDYLAHGVEPYLDIGGAVDAVEVVRCADCKHADAYYHCDYSAVWNSKNDYCCHGERKDG